MIGDSHAAHLFYGIDNALGADRSDNGIVGFYVSGQCPFMYVDRKLGVINRIKGKEFDGSYYKNMLLAYDYVVKSKNITTVLLTHSIGGAEYDVNGDNSSYYNTIYNSAKRTFDFLVKHNKHVVYIIDNPSLPYYPYNSGMQRKFFYKRLNEFSKELYWNKNMVVEYNKAVYAAAKGNKNVTIIDNTKLFCDNKFCYSFDRSKGIEENIFLDTHHLNPNGSVMVGKKIVVSLKEILDKKR